MLPRLNLEKFCQTYNVDFVESGHHHCHQGWIQVHCPFCTNGTHGFHLGFSLTKGNFNCWRCGGHTSWKVVAAILKTNRNDQIMRAFNECAEKGDLAFRVQQAREARQLVVPPFLEPLTKRHKDYLRGRGYNATKVAEEWDLQGTRHLSGDWSQRVVAPIQDAKGRIVAYVGRTIQKNFKQLEIPKYKVSDKDECLIDPTHLVYGIHKARPDGVVVVEGPADVWRMGPGAVALLGIDWKRAQASALRRFRRRFVLFDSKDKKTGGADRNAQRRATKLASYISMYAGDTEIVDGFDTDPGEFSDRYAAKVMKELLG